MTGDGEPSHWQVSETAAQNKLEPLHQRHLLDHNATKTNKVNEHDNKRPWCIDNCPATFAMITPPNCTATCIVNHEQLLGVVIQLHIRKQTRSASSWMREKDWRCQPATACGVQRPGRDCPVGLTSPALGALHAGGSISHFCVQWWHSYQKQVFSAPL